MSLLSWRANSAWALENQIGRLARLHFPRMRLTECESNLLAHVSTGEVAYCGPSHGEKDKVPEDAGKGRMRFDVAAELIRWLCTDPVAIKLVDPRGIRLHAARIVGQLDLSFTTVAFPLAFADSRFVENIKLDYGQLINFFVTGSQIHGIQANNSKVRGDFVLSNTVSAEGQIRLDEANLEGDLAADGGTLKNPGRVALYAEHLKATNVFFIEGFSADGAVDLKDATLNGDLVCAGGRFKNPGGHALIAEGLKAAGVVLSGGFSAEGEVLLIGADVGVLNGYGGTFKNPDNVALDADHLRAASVILANVSVDGEVNLSSATLNGSLDCDGGTFKNRGKVALVAENLKASDVFLKNHFSADGEVDLTDATLGNGLECDGGTFENPGGTAFNADGLKAGIFDITNFRLVGALDFIAAHVEGPFIIWTKVLPEQVVLDLRHATVGSFFDDWKSWPRQGNLHLDGFVYNGFGGGQADAESRLRWLDLQHPRIPSMRQRFFAYVHRLLSGEKQRNSRNSQVDFRPQPFEQLAKVLRENGDDVGANRVLIAMENARWWYGNIGFWKRCWSWSLWITIGYGYDTWRALWFIGGFVILGTFLFFWGHRSEAIVQLDREKMDHFFSFNPFVYSLETFLPLVELHQAKHWGPDPEIHKLRPEAPLAAFQPLSKYQHQFGPAFGKHLRWYLWFHILAGWFFTSMLIAGITGLAQKG